MDHRDTRTIAHLQGAPCPPPPAVEEELPAGALVGRYVVLGKVGQGGMGTVYAAYDPELERKVALKFLRRGARRDHPGLEREARALASLSHPNIVTIFELGSYHQGEEGERIFVAMELVDGMTFGRWLKRARRPWSRVLDVALAAGRGLAAAHARGIVHGDFKPSNLMVPGDDMVTDQGEVRVLDFGLAAPERSREPAKAGEFAHPAVLGTPGYMAPEVLAGTAADARSDQYSYCATLYEALWGSPYDPAAERQRSPRDLPGWLREAVLRGLDAEPARRYGSMEELLAALDYRRRTARRRRRELVGGLVVAAAAVLAMAAWASLGYSSFGSVAPPTCDGAQDRIGEVWGPPQRQAVATAFAASGLPAGEGALRLTGEVLDRYAVDWAERYTAACRATHVLGEQSPQLLDQRMLCLNGALAEVESLVGLFQRVDGALVLRSVEAARGLPDLDRCEATEELARRPELPRGSAQRAELQQAVVRLAQQRALENTGRPLSATTLEEIAVTARRQGAFALEAETLELLGRWQMNHAAADENLPGGSTEDLLRRAFLAALEGADRATEALAAIDLIRLFSWEQDRQQEGDWWRRHAEALVDSPRVHRGDLAARLYKELGGIAVAQSRWREAQEHYRRALAVAEATWPAEDPRLIPYLSNVVMMDPDRGDELLQRTLAIIEKSYGPWSPQRCRVSVNHAGNLVRAGRYGEAYGWAEDCLASQEQAYGERHREMVYPLLLSAEIQLAQDRPKEAERLLRRALPIAEAGFGPEHQMVASLLQLLGTAHLLQLEIEPARQHYLRALELSGEEESLSRWLEAVIGLVRLSAVAGDPPAKVRGADPLEILAQLCGGQSLRDVQCWVVLGEGHLARGHRDLARQALDEALTIPRPPADELVKAEARLVLARVLPPEEQARALELVRSSLPLLADGSPWTLRRRAEGRTWLARFETRAAR